jgi:hypothetical protein
VDAVDRVDLSVVEDNYNQVGDGRAAMLATLVFPHAHKVLRFRLIEIACLFQLVNRWLSGQAQPDDGADRTLPLCESTRCRLVGITRPDFAPRTVRRQALVTTLN